MAHPNEDLIREAYDAFGSGDRDTIEELFAVNIAFHVSEGSPGPYRDPYRYGRHGCRPPLAFG